MIKIARDDYQKIVDHAIAELPNEACGLIAGKIDGTDKLIEKVYLLTNMDHSNEHFSLDPKEQLSAIKDMRSLGYVPLGNWHSHPETPSRPSEEDKRLAHDKNASYLILSLMDQEKPVLNSFHIESLEASKEELIVEAKNISAEDFAKVDFSKATLLDLREKDEVLVAGIEGAINIPFSQISSKLSDVPKELPVYVFCRTGDWSEEVAEILSERGYDTYNLEGGFKAYQEYLANAKPVEIDAKGLKCPGPIVKVADVIRNLADGQKVFVEATEDAFASDIAVWCQRTGNHLEKLEVKSDVIQATIEKRTKLSENLAALPDGKTFVVFSGDLDKTIAAFIMANGAAAMGRKVTIFFTFWGLNILRRPNKIKAKKSFIEKMFGIMMPRGTKKLGLSRMNMGGAGAKMIRAVMKSKGVSSLEELMQTAIDHGVRLVACQMSMEIMGIKKEELIDGVELGGVATFLGSGEQSNMSLFI